MRTITYKCGCETEFEEKEGQYEVCKNGHFLCNEHASKAFQLAYYKSNVWAERTKWLNKRIMKNPMDMMMIQEIICDTRPDVIVETGTFHGGSALFMATILDNIKKGTIFTVENDNKHNGNRPQHRRIHYIEGDSTSDDVVNDIKKQVNGAGSVMVCLDSDHNKDNVLKEMEKYCGLVTIGNYLIVEDTNINNPMKITKKGIRIYQQGPHEAVEEFLKTHDDFMIDKSREKFMFTFNPDGYLKKIQ